ncbi:hypothetical protein DdX_16054 [Ditylenchus destructor]|uniref:F-box domain-containing protein n=1 Tax=Ditylenchus destructor TaxID=166010 RepID=A0AAD4MR21_9BILA|nr:hypothetical protein DdX_16054 [Ditylenchus destructor]
MGLSLRRPSKRFTANSRLKHKLSSNDETIIAETLPKNSMKIGQVKLHPELLLEILKYFSRKRLCELKLVNNLFRVCSDSSALNSVQVISSLEIPGALNGGMENAGKQPEHETKPLNRYQRISEEKLEYYVGFNEKGYPSFSVFDIPPSRYIRFRYVTLRMGDNRKFIGLTNWISDNRHCFVGCTLDYIVFGLAYVSHFVRHIILFDQCSEIVLRIDDQRNLDHEWPTPTDMFSTCDVILSCNTIHFIYGFSLKTVYLDSILYWLHFGGTAPRTLIIYEDNFFRPDVKVDTLIERIKTLFINASGNERNCAKVNFQLIANGNREKDPFLIVNRNVMQQLSLFKSEMKPGIRDQAWASDYDLQYTLKRSPI